MIHVRIITGSRHVPTERAATVPTRLEELLSELPNADRLLIVEGAATGVDSLARRWANGHQHRVFLRSLPALWDLFRGDRQAGTIRNEELLRCALAYRGQPDIATVECLAFPGPKSRGTWDMVRRCQRAGLVTRIIRQDGDEVITTGDLSDAEAAP